METVPFAAAALDVPRRRRWGSTDGVPWGIRTPLAERLESFNGHLSNGWQFM
jgi:hypothetical protein